MATTTGKAKATANPHAEMYAEIKAALKKRIGGGWDLISDDMRRALVNSGILEICVRQDDKRVPDAAVRRVMKNLYACMLDDFYPEG